MNIVGNVSAQVEALLGINITGDRNIYLGQSNIRHMITSHPNDYTKYGAEIRTILSSPDYVGLNPNDGSIEYVKEYVVDGEFVKVAVRVSQSGKLFARSLYILNNRRVYNYIAKNTLKKA